MSQTIYVAGGINSNTTWNADTVKIIGDVVVDTGIILTILPGTYLEAQGYYRIDVHGSILAVGEPMDSICFTVDDTTSFWLDTTSVAGGWGGINITSDINSLDSSKFEYCKIQYGKRYDNYSGNIKGGSIYVKDYGGLIIKSCTFSNNMVICYEVGVDGACGGAIYCAKTANVFIDSNVFSRNRSFDHGGAIHIGSTCLSTTISNNLFLNNSAFWIDYSGGWVCMGGVGAAVCISDLGISIPKVFSNKCFNNKSLNASIYTSIKNALVYNNVICNNWGPGIMDGSQLSHVRYFNNTIVNNQSYNGGILLISNAHAFNNIVWNNVEYPGQVKDQIEKGMGQNPDLFYNCVQYGDGGDSAIYEYPEFVSPSAGIGLGYDGSLADWSLVDESPCINTGTPDTAGLKIPEYDVLGNPRIYGNRIEIGAFENQNVWTSIHTTYSCPQVYKVFPNPGYDEIHLTPSNHSISFELLTLTGQTVLRENLFEPNIVLLPETISSGVYIYRIMDKNNTTIQLGKWIKHE